jgi:hypothetical protein
MMDPLPLTPSGSEISMTDTTTPHRLLAVGPRGMGGRKSFRLASSLDLRWCIVCNALLEEQRAHEGKKSSDLCDALHQTTEADGTADGM